MKHYIRLDEDNYIVEAYSDAFLNYVEGDILLCESESREFEINGEKNPLLFQTGQPKYKYVNGEIIESVKPLSDLEKLAPIKSKRNMLLEASDFMVLPDAPYTSEQIEAIKIYRQALRDLPVNVDLDNPVFPVKPI